MLARVWQREASLTGSEHPPRRTPRELGYEDLGQLGQNEPAWGRRWSNGSNVIPRRARPGLAGLGPHIEGYLAHKKRPPRTTLQYDHPQGPMVALEGRGL